MAQLHHAVSPIVLDVRLKIPRENFPMIFYQVATSQVAGIGSKLKPCHSVNTIAACMWCL